MDLTTASKATEEKPIPRRDLSYPLQLMTLNTEQDFCQAPVDVDAASNATDEKCEYYAKAAH